MHLQNVEVSADCLDMVTQVLVADPAQRMGMEDIKQHRWFLAGLPMGALDMNEFLLRCTEPQTSSVCALSLLLTHPLTACRCTCIYMMSFRATL